jgi:phage/plasmid-associated DNA primase
MTYLKDDALEMDTYTWQLHFNNGYINLKNGEFKKRKKGVDFVTYHINRDYVPSTSSQRKELRHHINKIYKNKEDRACILSYLSRCLIGKPEHDQDTLFLMGHGSSGKSFILELTRLSLGNYVELFQSDTFEANNSKRDKILNEFSSKKWVLIAWINEFSDKKISDSDFKNFCDGTVKVTKLYVDGTFSIKLRCKLIATTNIMPNLQINTGSSRRFLAFTHQSLFVDNKKEVNEDKMIYQKDKYLLEKIQEGDNLLNAWVDILIEKCIENYNNKAPDLTKNFKDTTSSVISTNDIIQDFIDAQLVITNEPTDRIGKNDMRTEFIKIYPEKHLTVQQLISSLKEKKIQYEAKFRHNNVQGCYIGVKHKNIVDEKMDFVQENKELRKEIEALKEKQCLFKNIKESKPVKKLKMKEPEYDSSEAKSLLNLF